MKVENSNFRLIKLCHSFSPSYFLLMFLNSLFSNLSPYYNIYLSAEIVNEIAGDKNIKSLILLILITVFGNLCITVIGGVISNRFTESGVILSYNERQHYMQKHLHMDYRDFENPEIRQLSRMVLESAKINKHGKELLLSSVNRILNAVINTIMALFVTLELFVISFSNTSWQITLMFLFIMVFLIIINIIYNIKMKAKNADVANKTTKAMIDNNRIDNAIESYNMGKDIRLYRQDSIIMEIKNKRLDSHMKAFEAYSLHQLKTLIPLYVLSTLLSMTAYIYVAYNCIIGSFGIGNIIKYIGISNKFIAGILSIFRSLTDIKTNKKYVDDYLAYFDIPFTMQNGTKSIKTTDFDKEAIIEFRNVSFRYPSSQRYAIKNINCKIFTGERIGIVGQNGSGKTTFIKLLCRLYDPTEGEILFNGTNIKEYTYTEYIKKLSVVFQDFKLFSFSLGQNISGNNNYDSSLVVDCLCRVGFEERLNKTENGIETFLYKDFDTNGIEVSGGEAQKIALARALYKDSKIVILDEPTSALDPIAEADVYSKFDEIIGKKTAVYISHRLFSCRNCDKILVFDDGVIIQCGSHKELLSNSHGKYFELWSAQSKYYEI